MSYLKASILLPLAFWACSVSGNATAQGVQLSSDEQQVTLVELFTSEGCSSCPPADRFLSELRTDPGLWRDFAPLAFHVDYWDYIGWRDRFANAEFSARQRQYAREGGVNVVYTPGLFQNGFEWLGWRRGERPHASTEAAGRLALNIDGNQVSVAYRASDSDELNLEVHVALLGLGIESRITAGENDGRLLRHDFVVLGLNSTALAQVAQRYSAELSMPRPVERAPQYAVVAWVSERGRQAPLQAVGGSLDLAAAGLRDDNFELNKTLAD